MGVIYWKVVARHYHLKCISKRAVSVCERIGRILPTRNRNKRRDIFAFKRIVCSVDTVTYRFVAAVFQRELQARKTFKFKVICIGTAAEEA